MLLSRLHICEEYIGNLRSTAKRPKPNPTVRCTNEAGKMKQGWTLDDSVNRNYTVDKLDQYTGLQQDTVFSLQN